ncbi:S1 family peptidase [Austwickia chelonae]|uniref:S1 family peptidase n=1 Tax=Austwickia chelonae TaxID=100225 RepID=UPI000E227DCD|nr:serine protease [Austwickia chelonae]
MKDSVFRARRLGALVAIATFGMALAPSGINAAAPDNGPGKDSTHIIGGVAAAQDEFPFMVSLQRNGQHFCGGSLINPGAVLTAAHCVEDIAPAPVPEEPPAPAPAPPAPTPTSTAPAPTPSAPAPTSNSARNQPSMTLDEAIAKTDLVIGRTKLSDTSQGVVRKIAREGEAKEAKIAVHPKYGKETGFDIAIVLLDQDVSGVMPVRIPTGNTDSLLAPGAMATVAGWGNMDTDLFQFPDRLRKVDVPILSDEECLTNAGKSYNPKSDICAGRKGKDSCQGDSGGPLMRKIPGRDEYFQIGVVSWGAGCAAQGGPGFYTSVSSSEVMDGLRSSARAKSINLLR